MLASEFIVIALFFGLLVFALGRGLVARSDLVAQRRHVIIGTFILAAIITPPDVFSQTLLAIPMLAVYEFALRVIAR